MLGPFATTSCLTPIQQMSLAVLSRAACASMSTTTTTTCDRGDRYGPMEWAQWSCRWHLNLWLFTCMLKRRHKLKYRTWIKYDAGIWQSVFLSYIFLLNPSICCLLLFCMIDTCLYWECTFTLRGNCMICCGEMSVVVVFLCCKFLTMRLL